MKKVINGKMYDTEADLAIAFYEVSDNTNSRYYFRESLHMTRGGEFYLHGTGGFFTQYAMICEDGSKAPGEDLILMPIEKTKRWVKLHYGVGLIADPRFASMIIVLGM